MSITILYPEDSILLLNAKQSRPLGEFESSARISSSGYSLYACSEIGGAIELERMRAIIPN